MIEFNSHLEVIEAFKDADRELDQESIDMIKGVSQSLIFAEMPDHWAVFEGTCRICSYVRPVIVPMCNNIDNLECGNCHNMTVQETEEREEWQS